jgi:hypothetical protein
MENVEVEDQPDRLPQCRSGRCLRMTDRGLCEHCREQTGRWLAELGSLIPRLPDELAPGGQGESDKVSGSREAPLPVSVGVLNLLGPAAGVDRRMDVATGLDPGDKITGPMQQGAEPLLSALSGWVRVVAEEKHLTRPAPKRLRLPERLHGAPFGPETARDQVRRLAAFSAGNAATLWERKAEAVRGFLARHHDWAAGQPWADEYAADMHDAWHAAKTAVGDWPARPEHMAGVECPRCDARALWRHPGQDGRTCEISSGGCGQWYSDEDWERWVKLAAWYAKRAGLTPKQRPTRPQLDSAWLRVKAAEDATGHEFGCGCERCAEVAWAEQGEAA